MQSRRVQLELEYQGKNISTSLAPYLLSFSFQDNVGKADDLNLTLHDREGLWRGDWIPTKGDKLKATFVVKDWNSLGKEEKLYCGKFYLDEITATGPESRVTLKASSIPVGQSGEGKSSIHFTRKTRAWEDTTLKAIAQDVAKTNGLSLHYGTSKNPHYERRDQREKSDAAFVEVLAVEAGLFFKLTATRLAILDRGTFSQSERGSASATGPVVELSRKGVLSWSLTSKCAGIYKSCRVKYHNPVKKETIESIVIDDLAPDTGEILELNQRVESIAAAQELASNKLSVANSKEITGNLIVVGNVKLVAGGQAQLSGFGVFDGRYVIEQATHKIDGSGYTTSISIYRDR